MAGRWDGIKSTTAALFTAAIELNRVDQLQVIVKQAADNLRAIRAATRAKRSPPAPPADDAIEG
jgi:hypothetical protein